MKERVGEHKLSFVPGAMNGIIESSLKKKRVRECLNNVLAVTAKKGGREPQPKYPIDRKTLKSVFAFPE